MRKSSMRRAFVFAVSLCLVPECYANGHGAPPSVTSTAATTPTTEVRELREANARQAAIIEELARVADGLDFDRAVAALRIEWLHQPRQKRAAVLHSIIAATRELAR